MLLSVVHLSWGQRRRRVSLFFFSHVFLFFSIFFLFFSILFFFCIFYKGTLMIEVPLVAKPGSFVCFFFAFCGLYGSFLSKYNHYTVDKSISGLCSIYMAFIHDNL